MVDFLLTGKNLSFFLINFVHVFTVLTDMANKLVCLSVTCALKALTPSDEMSDRDRLMAKPVPLGERYQFCVTRQRRAANRFIAQKLSADFASKVKFKHVSLTSMGL